MKRRCSSTLDIISDLPDNVIDNVLLSMPILDAVRTSILSRKWRYKWSNLSQLVFDDTFSPKALAQPKEVLVCINQILLLHSGPIPKFTLNISKLESSPEIDQMILFLSRNGIRELTIKIWQGEHHKLPTCIYSCLHLSHLDLWACIFQPPPTFKGYCRLVSLVLREVIFPADIFGTLLSSCPLLERLIVEDSTDFDCLDIDAPNLRYFDFNGTLRSICFKNTPLLAVLSMASDNTDFDKTLTLNKPKHPNLTKAFGQLAMLENLHLGYFFVKLLAVGNIPRRISTTLKNLKTLELSEISLSQKDEVLCTLCLIRISPNLQKLSIQVFDSNSTEEESALDFLVKQEKSDVSLDKLQEVHIRCVSGLRPELEFIKFLFAKSPELKTMHIEHSSTAMTSLGYKILKDMSRFPRASSKAELIYVDPEESQP